MGFWLYIQGLGSMVQGLGFRILGLVLKIAKFLLGRPSPSSA